MKYRHLKGGLLKQTFWQYLALRLRIQNKETSGSVGLELDWFLMKTNLQGNSDFPIPIYTAARRLESQCWLKRSSGMSNLLGKIGAKKQKMSTLEKSKLDWESFKEEEGIGEELAIHNRGKEGYIERKAFLDRVDHRQFEIERDLRLSKMKP
ncbi:hypothetical protein H8959_001643 [Pygathrix nigripes]